LSMSWTVGDSCRPVFGKEIDSYVLAKGKGETREKIIDFNKCSSLFCPSFGRNLLDFPWL